MLRIWIDPHHCPIEPAFVAPDFGIEKNLNPVANSDFVCHSLFAAICPEHDSKTDDNHNSTVNRPLRIAGHGAARQDVDPLQEKCTASQDEEDADDVEKCFHFLERFR
jgi:hypothetical protein